MTLPSSRVRTPSTGVTNLSSSPSGAGAAAVKAKRIQELGGPSGYRVPLPKPRTTLSLFGLQTDTVSQPRVPPAEVRRSSHGPLPVAPL